MNSTIRTAIIVVLIIIIALLGFLVWKEDAGTAAPTTATSTVSGATTTTVDITVSSSTPQGSYTVTPITASSAPAAPDYKTPLSYAASMSADDRAQDQSQFAAIQTTLASDPTDYSSWIGLGILREETGDYAGAAADWKYVTEIYPTDPTAFANLGNLYATYVSDPSQAVADYKEAIKLDPTREESFYQNLAQVYLAENDTADAKATLQQGIAAQVVGYQNLQSMLNSIQ